MKILVICDDFYHSGDIVEQGFSTLSDEFDFTVVRDTTDFQFSPSYDVITLCKDDQTSPTNKDGWFDEKIGTKLTDYVEQGGGLLVMHAGTVACKRIPSLKALVGCEFITHPEQCDVEHIPDSNNAITAGINPFTEKDEHYFIDVTATDIDTFLVSRSQHGNQTAGYTRRQGKGAVCVLTPGHNLTVWQNPEYQRIIKNALAHLTK